MKAYHVEIRGDRFASGPPPCYVLDASSIRIAINRALEYADPKGAATSAQAIARIATPAEVQVRDARRLQTEIEYADKNAASSGRTFLVVRHRGRITTARDDQAWIKGLPVLHTARAGGAA